MTARRVRNLIDLACEDLDAVVQRDPGVRSRAEALLYPQVSAIWLHRLAHRWYERRWRLAATAVAAAGRVLSGVDVHPGAQLGRRLFIDHGLGTVIGETAVVGDDVTIYHRVTVGSVGWRPLAGYDRSGRRHPVIGDGVTLGANASVLGPVRVGDCASIGAHCLVTTDVPAGARVRAAADPACDDGPGAGRLGSGHTTMRGIR